jgi:hypothetical protein
VIFLSNCGCPFSKPKRHYNYTIPHWSEPQWEFSMHIPQMQSEPVPPKFALLQASCAGALIAFHRRSTHWQDPTGEWNSWPMVFHAFPRVKQHEV